MSHFARRPLVLIAVFLLLATACNRNGSPNLDALPLQTAEELTETVILPTTSEPITPGQNYVYCGTFQLAWNELCDTLNSSTLELADGPAWLATLNERPFDGDDLAEDSYVAMGGLTEDDAHEQITAEMKRKFPNASLTLPSLPDGASFFTYAYLAKSLAFQHAFHRLDGQLQFPQAGDSVPVAAFGLASYEGYPERELGDQVTILDYVSDDDFILELITTSENDRMVLAKVTPEATLAETIATVENRIATTELEDWQKDLHDGESLRVPLIQLGVVRNYQELLDKPLTSDTGGNPGLALAQQRILFQLDETGAQLESDASMAVLAVMEGLPRQFDFDAPFLLYLQQADADAPYFAIWIETAEVLAPVEP